jgi:hypothetical protein
MKSYKNKDYIISYEHEYYGDGSNLIFQIYFPNLNKTTGAFNDNHEFGDDESVLIKSKQMADWYMSEDWFVAMIDEGMNHPRYWEFRDEWNKFIKTIL